jgi:hypothetical protein
MERLAAAISGGEEMDGAFLRDLIHLFRTMPAVGQSISLGERVRGFAPRELKVSAVTAFELEYGARRSNR